MLPGLKFLNWRVYSKLSLSIRIAHIEEQIQAEQHRVWQYITTFGTEDNGSETSSRILSNDNGKMLVEFKTPVPLLFGMKKVFRTVEQLTLHEPELVEFEEIEGPFASRREHISLQQRGTGTKILYEADFAVGGWLAGWLLGILLIRPALKKAVRQHLAEIKHAIEVQAEGTAV